VTGRGGYIDKTRNRQAPLPPPTTPLLPARATRLRIGIRLGREATRRLSLTREGEWAGVTPPFLAPNKSPNKSCVFSKLSSRAQLPLQTLVTVPPSHPGASAANPAGTARTQASTHARLPNASVGHRAGNPAHAAVPTAGPPRHHRRPGKRADARKSEKSRKTLPLISLTIFQIF
jgi:hypothetical protein